MWKLYPSDGKDAGGAGLLRRPKVFNVERKAKAGRRVVPRPLDVPCYFFTRPPNVGLRAGRSLHIAFSAQYQNFHREVDMPFIFYLMFGYLMGKSTATNFHFD